MRVNLRAFLAKIVSYFQMKSFSTFMMWNLNWLWCIFNNIRFHSVCKRIILNTLIKSRQWRHLIFGFSVFGEFFSCLFSALGRIGSGSLNWRSNQTEVSDCHYINECERQTVPRLHGSISTRKYTRNNSCKSGLLYLHRFVLSHAK